ncbi:MAG: helix-turn-helix transcriptional regulator [Clostridia bacterium]|nr:helix-turn-helix transcriptional regulator [Clostridia bacterium]MBQ6530187.1 helix-turn-helix transcriptional regulator [Clostridia bacterium]
MEQNNISNRIKELREKKQMTQSELAAALYVKQQTIAQWEKGERDLKTNSIIDLAKYFNVTSDYLLGLSDIQNTDIDIQAVCKYTGFEEKALANLLVIKNKSNVLIKILNKLIENYNFFGLLKVIDKRLWEFMVDVQSEEQLLKSFITDNNLEISQMQIEKRGRYALDEKNQFEYEKYKLRNHYHPAHDSEYTKFQLYQRIGEIIDELYSQMIDDPAYQITENIEYGKNYLPPYEVEKYREEYGIELKGMQEREYLMALRILDERTKEGDTNGDD